MDEGFTLQHEESTVETPSAGSAAPKLGKWVLGKARSDPYVVCRTIPAALAAAAAPVRTEHVVQSLNPTWAGSPVLSLRADSFETLKQ